MNDMNITKASAVFIAYGWILVTQNGNILNTNKVIDSNDLVPFCNDNLISVINKDTLHYSWGKSINKIDQ